MNEQSKTITTKLTHDIIKKDFFALHVSYLKIAKLVLLPLVSLVLFWFLGHFTNTTIGLTFFGAFLGFLCVLFFTIAGTLLYQILCIIKGKYQVVTVPVTKREDRYTLAMKPMRRRHPLFTHKTDKLLFGRYGKFRLEKHTYYKWSPMFELTDEQIFEHAQLGVKYHLIMVEKNIVMIYNAETFLMK